MNFRLRPTGQRERRTCPGCGATGDLEVMEPEAGAPLALTSERILQCSKCGRLAIPAGIMKRFGGLLLLAPFLGLIATAAGTGSWMLWGMVEAREASWGFVLVALALIGAAATAGRFALRTLKRLVAPGSLLPLVQTSPGQHDFSGEL